MKQILCFGDSNTWGLDGDTGKRLEWGKRWTSILQMKLEREESRIIEEGLCGRTTVFDDPLRNGRCGTEILPVLLETHAPVDNVILMLGTNDCKTAYGASAELIGKGIICLLDQIERLAPQAKILLISPIYLGEKIWQEGYDQEFSKESVVVSKKLETVYEKIARERKTDFIKASDYAGCSEKDQEHMNVKGHEKLADAIYHALVRTSGYVPGLRICKKVS